MEKATFFLLASLSSGGRLISTGRVCLDHCRKEGSFRPIDGAVPDSAPQGIRLQIIETGVIVPLTDFRSCPRGAADYHFSTAE